MAAPHKDGPSRTIQSKQASGNLKGLAGDEVEVLLGGRSYSELICNSRVDPFISREHGLSSWISWKLKQVSEYTTGVAVGLALQMIFVCLFEKKIQVINEINSRFWSTGGEGGTTLFALWVQN